MFLELQLLDSFKELQWLPWPLFAALAYSHRVQIANWIDKVKFEVPIFLFATIFRLILKPTRHLSVNETWFYEDNFIIGSLKVMTDSLEL